MNYTPVLVMPEGWRVTLSESHIEAVSAKGSIEIIVGDMPDEDTPEDEIFANYADMVGFDGDDDEAPIQCFTFNGKKAWGFSVFDEQENIVNVFCQESKKGICSLFTVTAPDFASANELMTLLERGYRLTAEHYSKT